MAATTIPRQPALFVNSSASQPTPSQSSPSAHSSNTPFRPIRSMLDIEPVHEPIPEENTNFEENQSTDGSDGHLEPVTPTDNDTHQFLYIKTNRHDFDSHLQIPSVDAKTMERSTPIPRLVPIQTAN